MHTENATTPGHAREGERARGERPSEPLDLDEEWFCAKVRSSRLLPRSEKRGATACTTLPAPPIEDPIADEWFL